MHINIAIKQFILFRLYIVASLVLQSPEQLTLHPDVFHPVYSCCSAIMRRAIKPSQTSTLFQLKKKLHSFPTSDSLQLLPICATSSTNRQHVCTDICGNISLALLMRVQHLIFNQLHKTFVWYLVACVLCVHTHASAATENEATDFREPRQSEQSVICLPLIKLCRHILWLISQKIFCFEGGFSCPTNCILTLLAFLTRADDT